MWLYWIAGVLIGALLGVAAAALLLRLVLFVAAAVLL